MRFLIISDSFSLDNWLVHGREPHIMPAVYEWFNFLGESKDHSFHAILVHPEVSKIKYFPNGSLIQIIKLPIRYRFLRKLISLIILYKQALAILRKKQFDIIYGMSIYAVLSAIIGRRKNIFSVSRIFGSLVYDLIQKRNFVYLYTRYILQYLEIIIPSNITICTDDGTQFDLANRSLKAKGRVYMLPNGIKSDLRVQLQSIPPVIRLHNRQAGKMLSIGRLTAWKRHDLAIRFFELLKTKYRWDHWILNILGEGRLKPKLETLIQTLNLTAQVKILDPVPHSKIPEFLSEHDIYLSMYEASNLSNSMWEAALAGRFICTRPTGNTADFFFHMKNCLISDDLTDMARCLDQISKEDVSHITISGRQTVDSLLLDWTARFQKEINIIYNELQENPQFRK